MPLTEEDLARIARMSHSDLVRGALSEDLAVGIEATLRLKKSTERLTIALIALTVVLVSIEIYHLFWK